MPGRPPIIAVLDDEDQMLTALGRLLCCNGFDVALFQDGAALLTAETDRDFDCIVLDLHMPGCNGFDILTTLATKWPSPPMIVITGHDEPGNCERAMTLGACAYLLKPVDAGPLLKAIQRGIRRSEEGNRHAVLNDGSIFKSRFIADRGAHLRPDRPSGFPPSHPSD